VQFRGCMAAGLCPLALLTLKFYAQSDTVNWFCKLLTTVAIQSGGGEHMSQVPQWHNASVPDQEGDQRGPGERCENCRARKLNRKVGL